MSMGATTAHDDLLSADLDKGRLDGAVGWIRPEDVSPTPEKYAAALMRILVLEADREDRDDERDERDGELRKLSADLGRLARRAARMVPEADDCEPDEARR